MNDSLESFFPKKYKSITDFIVNEEGKIIPQLELNDDIMVSAYEVFVIELENITNNYKMNKKILLSLEYSIEHLKTANELSKKWKFSGVLPNSTPGTIDKAIFLSSWPKKLSWTTKSQEDIFLRV